MIMMTIKHVNKNNNRIINLLGLVNFPPPKTMSIISERQNVRCTYIIAHMCVIDINNLFIDH